MQIHAASLGEAVPRGNFDARVHSVFDTAANLHLAEEDRLITLLISDRYELPQGIRLAKPEVPLQSLTPNLRAASRGGVLRFDSTPFSIDLRGVHVWRCPVPELGADMESSAVQQAWAAAWELLNREQKLKGVDIIAEDLFRSGAGPQLTQRMSDPVMSLVTSSMEFDPQGAMPAAEKIIGLGPGVTPSGDDILLGFLAGLWSTTSGTEQQSSFIRTFGDALMPLTKLTGEISRTYLYHAALGQFSSSLSNLAAAISQGGPVDMALEEAMRIGHSSGMDAATGLLIGQRIWNTKHILA